MLFIVTLIGFLVFILLMSIGVIFSNKGIKGSCAGLANIGIKKSCDCKDRCENNSRLYQIQEP